MFVNLISYSLDEEIWDMRLHFQGTDNMERKYSVSSDISYLTILALAELEGYGMKACLTYVKEEERAWRGWRSWIVRRH